MGDSISAIYDDMGSYERRCQKYREKVQFNERGNPDCYGGHSHYVEALEVREYIRSGMWDECNWCGHVTNFKVQDLDSKLDSILTHKSIPENKSVSIRTGSGGEPVPARFPTASPADGGGRFSLLELE
jgi:hypothetical protein